MTPETKSRFNAGHFIGGLLLIAGGIILLLERLDLAEFGDLVSLYWPSVIIFIGLVKLFRRDTVGSGVGTIAIGTWLQFVQLGLYGFTFRNSWPMVLIGVGAGMILQAIVDSAARGQRHGA